MAQTSEKTVWRTLGIIGAGRGTGVTHLTVWMANYLTGVTREKVAVLEWNDHGDFAAMEQFCTGRQSKEGAGKCFRILEADYYPQADGGVLADCLNGAYERILVDYGEMNEGRLQECIRCDRKILVGAMTEWRAEAFLEAVGQGKGRDKSWRCAAAFGSDETGKEMERAFHFSCLRIPASVDAFAITRSDMGFFETLLRG